MSAGRDLPSINRSRLFILPSINSLRQLRVPCWRRDMSNRFSYNDVWEKLCELFPAPRVTFDDHDHPEYSG
jgi:hypothetical protein